MGELEELNKITEAVIGAAIDVHRTLGPGLLESAYQACLAFELVERDMKSNNKSHCQSCIKGTKLTAVTGWIW